MTRQTIWIRRMICVVASFAHAAQCALSAFHTKYDIHSLRRATIRFFFFFHFVHLFCESQRRRKTSKKCERIFELQLNFLAVLLNCWLLGDEFPRCLQTATFQIHLRCFRLWHIQRLINGLRAASNDYEWKMIVKNNIRKSSGCIPVAFAARIEN